MGLFDRDIATLDIEATEARLMVARGKSIAWWDSIALPIGVMRNGLVAQPDVFGRTLVELFAKLRASRKDCVVAIGGQRSLVRILNLPQVEAKLLDETVRREARRELPLPLDELYLSWQVIGQRVDRRIQVFVLAVPREILDACMAGLRAGGLQPRSLDLKPLALMRAVNLPDVLIADVETATQDVILVCEGTPLIVRSIATPPGSGQAARTSADVADALATEIQRTLDFFNSSMAAGRPAWSPVVCLTGILSEDQAVRQRIAARWPLAQPVPPVDLPPDFPMLLYLTNVGLALKQA